MYMLVIGICMHRNNLTQNITDTNMQLQFPKNSIEPYHMVHVHVHAQINGLRRHRNKG